MGRRVLVTGASGFIGSTLVRALQDHGDTPVAMVRETSKLDNLEGREVELAYAPLSDVDAMAAAMRDVELVFHVAGLTAAFRAEAFLEANAKGVEHVLDAARRAGVDRVVYMSSLMAAGYSHPKVAHREHHVPNPGTHYGVSKLAGERAALRAAAEGMEVLIVRPPLVYGPRDTDVLQMIRSAKSRVVATAGVRAGGLSIIHAEDLVAGTILAAERGTPLPRDPTDHVLADGGEPADHIPERPDHPAGKGIYYLDDLERHTVSSFGHTAAQVLGRRAMTLPVPGPAVWAVAGVNQLVGRIRGKTPPLNLDKARGTVNAEWWCSSEKAVAELGYAPRYDIGAGLEHTIAWYRDRGWL